MGDTAKIDCGNERKGYWRGLREDKGAGTKDEDKMVVDLGRKVSRMPTRIELELYAFQEHRRTDQVPSEIMNGSETARLVLTLIAGRGQRTSLRFVTVCPTTCAFLDPCISTSQNL